MVKQNMKKIITILIITVLCALGVVAKDFGNEVLNYKVEYKWGLVNKKAGNVKISLNNKNDRYVCALTASSASWADKIYKVRDTLRCEVVKDGFRPVFYEKIAREGGDHKYDYLSYSYKGNTVMADCILKKWKDGKLVRDDKNFLQAESTTVDMLSAFFFMRKLPFTSWEIGHVHTANIFSGKRKELLTIKYAGIENLEYDNKTYKCYHIKFKFTSDGKKKTSDDLDAWIDTSGSNIPIKLEGKLPIGKIRCFYEGSK